MTSTLIKPNQGVDEDVSEEYNKLPYTWTLGESARQLLSHEDFVSYANGCQPESREKNTPPIGNKSRKYKRHNGELQEKEMPKQTLNTRTTKLPIHQHVSEIQETVKKHQITIISGETGSGKSTQVPQILLEDLELGKNCRIGMTQVS